MTTKRYVVDTNVLISAALTPDGSSRNAVVRIFAQGRLLFSKATFVELATRMMRPKFDKWASWETRLEFLDELAEFADWVEIDGKVMGCRDAADDKFLETALVGRADGIVTGDGDLLSMHPFEDIPVFAPGDWPD
jgi:putative PIN family toxin of toxin-antitoxin system